MAAPGLLAHVLVSKFADHLPLNRQEAMLRRAGIELARSTLCDWVLGSAQALRPLYEHLIAAVRSGELPHSDDTPVPLQEVGCWAHARRKFFEVDKTQKTPGLAHEAITRIGQFYHLDNAWKDLPPRRATTATPGGDRPPCSRCFQTA